ncbi:MAG: DUF4906 domain-containing protein [Bacteroidales bacterium]|nr:DUF4906 domain-containing protein [Bacteroidales bacterium]
MKNIVLFTVVMLLTLSCLKESAPDGEREEVAVRVAAAGATKSIDPPESRIQDVNFLLFTPSGVAEWRKYYRDASQVWDGGAYVVKLSLLKDCDYTLCVAANAGRALSPRTLDEAKQLRHYMAYPDEYSRGMLMSSVSAVRAGPGLELGLERNMAKVSLRIDRSALDKDVRLTARSVTVGGCPSSVTPFAPSMARSASDIFTSGFSKSDSDVSALNADDSFALSGEVSLYILENLQGDLLSDVTSDSGKVFTDSRYGEVCSWVEMKFEYHSPSKHTRPGEYLIYRFYLGESLNNFDVRRNVHYRITLRPEGDGLSEDGWRVDKEAIEDEPAKVFFDLHPSAYNECRSGDDFRIWCDISPSGTPVEIEQLAYDDHENVAELYDYTIDPDGHGLTIHTKKGGSALVYFNAGPPVNRDTLALLVIDP